MNDIVYLMMMNNESVSNEQKQKEAEYKKYVDNHINNVIEAWAEMKCNYKIVSRLDSSIMDNVDSIIVAHDVSKYGIEEWEPYRKNFYPIDEQEKIDNQRDFADAWAHHKAFNPHHWNHWTGKEDMMPDIYVIEMACDWIAMSKYHNKENAYEWYLNQKDIKLGDKQKELIEFLLKAFYHL